MKLRASESIWLLPGIFFISRLVLCLILQPEQFNAYGDLMVYYDMARLEGWPFFTHWIEYPPLFPLLNEGIFALSGGDVRAYFLLLTTLFAAGGAGVISLFQRLALRLGDAASARRRSLALFGVLFCLPYTWWYYDLLPLALMLLGLLWLLEGRSWHSGLALGVGMLAKWFPGLALAAALRYRTRHFWKIAVGAVGLTACAWLLLWAVSPRYTAASLASQPGRSSWQTVWAYLDGNRSSGAFVYWDQRYDPEQAVRQRGNPARFSPWLTLGIFGAAGLFCFWQVRSLEDGSLLAFTGLTWVLFLIWSPGWSPQWVMYLLPLILLTQPLKVGLAFCGVLLAVTLLEWPVFLSEYWFRGVFAMAGLRTLTFGALGLVWFRQTLK